MLKAEWKKLFSFRVLWILLACLLCVNGYIKISTAYSRYYTPKEYTSYFDEMDGMTLQEQLDYSQSLIDSVDENGYGEHTGFLLYDVVEICQELLDYPSYLESIDENAKNMTSVFIWGGADTFSYRNIAKTPSAYENLKGTELQPDKSLGVEDFLYSPITDLLGIALLFLCVCRIFLYDKEQGIIGLLYSTPKGRANLIFKKSIAGVLCGAFLVMLFYGEIAGIESILYGFGDLSRPIQCVFGYYTCNLPVSVGQYMGIYLLLKILAYAVFAVIFGLICTLAKNNLTVYACSGGICGLCYLLYAKISVLSPWSLFHFWNPVQFLNLKEILGTYTNVNFFGYPVSLKLSACMVMLFSIILLTACNMFLFCKQRNLQYKNISLSKKSHNKFQVHGKIWYTFYRGLVLQKGIIILFAVVIAGMAVYQTCTRVYNNDDIYYSNFCEEYAGDVNENTLDFIEEKSAEIVQIESQIAELENAENPNTFQLQELYSKLNDKIAFEKFKARVEQIPENATIFYDTGYCRYFGLDGNKESAVIALLILVALVLLLSPTVSLDHQTQMKKILFATQNGKIGYYKQFYVYDIIISVFATLMISVPYMVQILQKYGTQGFAQSINGMEYFAEYPQFLTVGMVMLGVILIRMVTAIFSGLVITTISSHCKSTISAYCINSVIFLLPIVLYLLGLDMFRFVGVIWLMIL